MTVESWRIVEDDPEFRQYRDLTENKHQPLPDGVMRWYSNQHHSYATPDGYLVPDTRLQAIADAWNEGTGGEYEWSRGRVSEEMPELAGLLDALTEENQPIEVGHFALAGENNDESL